MLLSICKTGYVQKHIKIHFFKNTKKFLRLYSSTKQASENILFDFNKKDTERILDLINTSSINSLSSYEISKTRLNKLEAHKLKNGTLNELNDILQIGGFSVKSAEKFYQSLLGEVPKPRPKRKTAPLVIPLIADSQINDISSCISMNIAGSSVIWSRIKLNKIGPCKLTHWEQHDIDEKKLHLHDLVHRCLYLNYLIPDADCYIFENPQVAQSLTPGNAEQVNINIQRSQLTAILGFALANRNKSENHSIPNLFYFKRFLSARLFQQLVGTERISAENVVLDLMRTNYNVEDIEDTESEDDDKVELPSSRNNLNFPIDLRMKYKEAKPYSRELLGQTLLLNLAFVRLVLLKDEKSRAKISRSKTTEV